MRTRLLLLLAICCSFFAARASHVMGGEITWKCSGNGYVFELVIYRDCNGAEVSTVSQPISVWNHPSVTTIPALFVSRVDISPTCTPITGFAQPLLCGTNAGGGNGVGAIEKITYRSNVVQLPGTAPAAGWIFTYDDFSRSGSITNLTNPLNFGLTITAKMFAIPGATAGVCADNSPRFLQDPYMVSCSGENYAYNMHAVDVELDSLNIAFGTPLNDLSGNPYNPPVNPAAIPFEPGFSVSSPTPNAAMMAGNVPAQLNSQSGELTFTSFTTGSFVVKVITSSYRQNVLIAQVEREMQLTVMSCTASNNAPVIAPPFAGFFETTIDAGTLVTFNIQSTDVEVLQDGSPQTNTLTTTGLTYGTNFTNPAAGCAVAPCATLNQSPPITGVQGASAQFSWQTDCAHLVTSMGSAADVVPYHFVFRIQDDYCPVPKVTYRTVTINVRSQGVIPATQINCITTAVNGDVTVSWDPIADPDGTFAGFELHSVQTGLIGTFPFGTTSAVVPSPGASLDFFVNVLSGCNGTSAKSSDTISNVYLLLLNPNNGTASLQWNPPAPAPLPGMSPNLTVLREYPTGTWTPIATLPYNTTSYLDTIDVCFAFLNYSVVYQTPTCAFNSNIAGDNFEDMLTPGIPVIASASIDTLTGNINLSWNQNYQPDTYGYVIYRRDANGFLVEIDTVYGITNTNYTDIFPVDGPLTYSVSAFDSCFTNATPQTYQTSAKGNVHTTSFLTHTVNSCDNTATLSWTAYGGWGANLTGYTVFMQENGGNWQNIGTLANAPFTTQLTPLANYCFAVRANNSNGSQAFSNLDCFSTNGPNPPAVHYLRVATVNGLQVDLRHDISTGSNVSSVAFEKYNPRNGQFEPLVVIPATTGTLTYTDAAVDVSMNSYRYRAVVIDSCGNYGTVSNEANTVLLKVTTDQTLLTNYIHWSSYTEFDGTVLAYQLFRGIDGNYDPTPIAVLPNDHRFYEDDVTDYAPFTGRFCYRVVAEEGDNQYGYSELSFSNEVCAAITPLVYIPNAFTPGGLNPVFLPIVSFIDINSYELTIIDRWGQRIFSTNDLTEGWNGEHQLTGKLVELGTYSYVLRVVDGNDQELMYRGSVTVIR